MSSFSAPWTPLPPTTKRCPTPHDQLTRRLKQRVPQSLHSWVTYALPPGQAPARHHLLLLRHLRDLADGKDDRLMVLMPPGSAKSTYASVLFPPWFLARFPGCNVLACSHTASLAGQFALRVRQLIADHHGLLGYRLGARRQALDFCLSNGGSYFAAGVRGAVTGRRADLILIDDPIRGIGDADSPVRRAQLWNWYRQDLLTRLKPHGRVVLIMTRWHEDDLGGRLLQAEPEDWRVLRLPALAEPPDPLSRAADEALWPEWEDEQALTRKRKSMGERSFAALFQQRPRPADDHLFKAARIAIVDDAAPVQCVRGWDLAATAARQGGDPDWTVGLKLGREASGRFVIMDVVRVRGDPYEVVNAIRQAALMDGVQTPISLPQDPGQAGAAQIRFLAAQLAGYRVSASRESGSKQTRAMPIAAQIEAGNLAVLRANWNPALMDELREFPGGQKDDQVDALARAFDAMVAAAAPARQTTLDLIGR